MQSSKAQASLLDVNQSLNTSHASVPLISVCIPTFNRAERLDRQVGRLVDMIERIGWDGVELLILDNFSDDRTPDVCKKWGEQLSEKIRYVRNVENLGLVGNYAEAIRASKGDYIWVVGDDDNIYDNTLARVCEVLRKYPGGELALLHMNHRCVDGITGAVVHECIYENVSGGEYLDGRELIKRCIDDRHSGGFMFITANVLNAELAKRYVSLHRVGKEDWVYPLMLVLEIAVQKRCYFMQEATMDCIYNVSCWKSEADEVLGVQVPKALMGLRKQGYEKAWILSKINKPKIRLSKTLSRWMRGRLSREDGMKLRAYRDYVLFRYFGI